LSSENVTSAFRYPDDVAQEAARPEAERQEAARQEMALLEMRRQEADRQELRIVSRPRGRKPIARKAHGKRRPNWRHELKRLLLVRTRLVSGAA
jgi:hypothetical protein